MRTRLTAEVITATAAAATLLVLARVWVERRVQHSDSYVRGYAAGYRDGAADRR